MDRPRSCVALAVLNAGYLPAVCMTASAGPKRVRATCNRERRHTSNSVSSVSTSATAGSFLVWALM